MQRLGNAGKRMPKAQRIQRKCVGRLIRTSGAQDEHAAAPASQCAGGSFTAADIEAIRTAQGNRCYLCGARLKKFHIDHFIPLALGGTNDAGNLRLACPTCNLSKGAKHPHDMGRLI